MNLEPTKSIESIPFHKERRNIVPVTSDWRTTATTGLCKWVVNNTKGMMEPKNITLTAVSKCSDLSITL